VAEEKRCETSEWPWSIGQSSVGGKTVVAGNDFWNVLQLSSASL